MATEAEQKEINDISSRMFASPNAPAHLVLDEKQQLGSTLARLRQPDVALTPAVPDIGFIHRQTNDAEIYFVANTSNARQSVQATFRVAGMQPEWWDAFSGKISPAEVAAHADGGTTIALELEPYGSRVLVFSKRTLPQPATRATANAAPPIDVSNDWRVSFGQNSAPMQMDTLRSWTEADATRYFSGVATYEKEVTVPDSMLQQGLAVQLDFGAGKPSPPQPLRAGMQAWLDVPVREAAVVYINDQRAGSIWCPPYSLDVTGLRRRGDNKIRIMVGNLALNYMAGRRSPDYRLLNLRYGERFQAQDMDKIQPVTAGLLGPIRLMVNAHAK